MKNLVIVESPTKARTISHFLGDDFVIKFPWVYYGSPQKYLGLM